MGAEQLYEIVGACVWSMFMREHTCVDFGKKSLDSQSLERIFGTKASSWYTSDVLIYSKQYEMESSLLVRDKSLFQTVFFQ